MARNPRNPNPSLWDLHMQCPYRLTLSGIDDAVGFESLHELTDLYGIEYGVLAHPDKHGTQRYPSKFYLSALADYSHDWNNRDRPDDDPRSSTDGGINLSLHLCGDYVEAFLEAGYCGLEEILHGYQRVQFNLGRTPTEEERLMILDWCGNYNVSAIIQVPAWTYDDSCYYLLDRSRGKGIHSDTWPDPARPMNTQFGEEEYMGRRSWAPSFAGGIGPDNLVETCKAITKHTGTYAIDMESSLRDERGEFSFKTASEVCALAYGEKMIYNRQVIHTSELQVHKDREEIRRQNAADRAHRREEAIAEFDEDDELESWEDSNGEYWYRDPGMPANTLRHESED